jgi:hypothetical protein
MTNSSERIARIREIADNDDPQQEQICLLTIQEYDAEEQPGSQRIVDYCKKDELAKGMIALAERYTAQGMDVLVGFIDARDASDDDWHEIIDYLVQQDEGERLADLCEAQAHIQAHQADEITEADAWEEMAMDPDMLAHRRVYQGAQRQEPVTGKCSTCGGRGVVEHPVIAGYFGDCPDCGVLDDRILM